MRQPAPYFKPDCQLRSAAVRCMLWVGLQNEIGNSGVRVNARSLPREQEIISITGSYREQTRHREFANI
jgi:hypothetical protein